MTQLHEATMKASELAAARNRESGLLVVGHGTREPRGIDEFWVTCQAIADADPALAIEGAFLEFAEPTIDRGVNALAARGVSRIVVMPLMLFAAAHAKRDIPDAVMSAARKHPQLNVSFAKHLSCHPSIVALSRQRFAEALGGVAPGSVDETVLVLVGRGSNDVEATAEMHQFARIRAGQRDAALVEVAFVSMASPSLTEALSRAGDSGVRRIVVQPHLLFGGVLIDRVAETVRDFAARYPCADWRVAGQLGPSELIVQTVRDRAPAVF